MLLVQVMFVYLFVYLMRDICLSPRRVTLRGCECVRV